MFPKSEKDEDTASDKRLRDKMVESQLRKRDISNERVLAAMREVPRHLFVPAQQQTHAYEDRALPLSQGQTISQPYIVALMPQLAACEPDDLVLDVGTGCGYQAAVLSRLVRRVISLELVSELAQSAQQRLATLGYDNVEAHHVDGTQGWKEDAPFDVILAAAAPAEVPPALKDQLAIGGRLVLPVGTNTQRLKRLTRIDEASFREETICNVAFVPLLQK